MPNIKKILSFFAFLCMAVNGFTQVNNLPEKNHSLMASEGKIYVVMVVVLTILSGLLLFLVRLDRKISKLEKNASGK